VSERQEVIHCWAHLQLAITAEIKRANAARDYERVEAAHRALEQSFEVADTLGIDTYAAVETVRLANPVEGES
jgi:hypothetical protein